MTSKKYWVTDERFKIIIIVLVMMWLILIIFFYLKAEEITKDPCSVCAKRMGTEVTCSIYNGNGQLKIFNPDYTIEFDLTKTITNKSINFSDG